ncbi:MAG: PD-(D/E)XK nuclease domain-containing protein, partial [Deltaproteobacteria bacterium]|nr:PD-(D/E)XK nuclease domain-containing protein [Deltaproteobacteria bacterium]
SFEIEHLEPETLLFQTGYLTIKEEIKLGSRTSYLLGFPNLEVRMSFTDVILNHYSCPPAKKEKRLTAVYRALFEARLDDLKEIFLSFFSSIPHDWYRKNQISEYEGYYASIFYSYFTAAGLDVTAEDTTNHGRIDLTVKIDDKIYIMEFKVIEVDKTKGSALEQIKRKKYSEK